MNTNDLAKIVGQVLQSVEIHPVQFVRQDSDAFVLRGGGGIEIRVRNFGDGSFSVALAAPDGTVIEGSHEQSIRRALHDAAARWSLSQGDGDTNEKTADLSTTPYM